MLNKKIQLSLIITLLFCVNAQAKKPKPQALTKSEITEKLAGNTVKGNGWSMLVTKDGKLKGVEGGYGDSGRWHASKDNLFCRTWNSWGQAQESCFQVFIKKQVRLKFKKVSGPTATFTGKLIAGNPKKL